MKNLESRVGTEENKLVKVMTYNALHGFTEISPQFNFEQDRFEAFKRVIEGEDPDVLLLTEACFGHENKHREAHDYAKMLDFPHQFYGNKGDSYWGSAILSKHPFVPDSTKNLGVSYGCKHEDAHLTSRIEVNGSVLQVDLAHPVPYSTEDEKRDFFEKVLKNRALKNYLLGGDFNAMSPQDQIDREKVIRGFSKLPNMDSDKATKAVNEAIKKKTIRELLDAGLIDTYRAINPNRIAYTCPTPLDENEEARLRLDYIFTDPTIHVVDSKIIKNKTTDRASDHYPLVSTFEIK